MNTRDALASLEQDVRYAARALRRVPGFTTVAVASLAVAAFLAAAALLATWWPARHAARRNPLDALKES